MVLKVDMLVSCNAPRNDRVGNKRCSPHKTTKLSRKRETYSYSQLVIIVLLCFNLRMILHTLQKQSKLA